MQAASLDKPLASSAEAHQQGRGRHADKPTDVPKAGWLDILSRTKQQISEDNLSIVAAGVAFYGFLAVVPALAALIALYGLIADPAQIGHHIEVLARVLPGEALPLLQEQMARITSHGQTAGIGAVVGFALALYSCANGTKALMTGLNISYGDEEKRGFLKLTMVAFVLTIGAIVGALLAVSMVAVLPSVLKHIHITGAAETFVNLARWPLLFASFLMGLAVVYRYGPSRRDAKWRWVSPGALIATSLWLVASGAFSFYVSKFASYDKTYGPLGSVVVFMMWLYLSAFVVLIGAEFNSELERQTVKDTTKGPEKPLGQRGAKSADTVGPARGSLPKERKT